MGYRLACAYVCVGTNVVGERDANAFLQAVETDCGASCPARSGSLLRRGRCMIDLTRGTGTPRRTYLDSSLDATRWSRVRGLVQSRTDNPITEQHREQRRREFVWRSRHVSGLIEITREDYDWFRFTVQLSSWAERENTQIAHEQLRSNL